MLTMTEMMNNAASKSTPVSTTELTTNLTTNSTTEALPMNTTQQTIIAMETANKSALLSTMGAELFQNGLNPREAMIAATAWVGATDYLDDEEMFWDVLLDGLANTSLEVIGATEQPIDELDGEMIIKAMVDAKYINREGLDAVLEMGPRFAEIVSVRTEAYKPAPAEAGVDRRFGYAPTAYSDLYAEAIHALEATEYTVDEGMLSIAKQVIAKMGGLADDNEGYVIKGCDAMDAGEAYVSEFKGDRRLRMYQASCHGPNGQSSDRSRALMDLFGVPTDYNIADVLPVVKAEMADMVTTKDSAARGKLVKAAMADPVEFIIKHIGIKEDEGRQTEVSKPYSFVKAAKILVGLSKGLKPYIGMAAGLDAKCSGPQYGALMVADTELAAACGFSLQQVKDAYQRCVEVCEKAGFRGLNRDEMKKPFMGIFYGQGWGAFVDSSEMSPALWLSIHGDCMIGSEEAAKSFHKAVTSSFGVKMQAVRLAVKSYGKKTQGKTSHFMPDGSVVAMNYKCKVNALGEAIEFDTENPDIRLTNNAETYKFIKFAMNTSEVHVGDFARNGFVNMIQATDALVARLIIVHLKRLGAKHIICVHDCFRVNVTEMHLLDQAIINAYSDLFGDNTNKPTKDLPMGTDILGLYFEGANKQLIEGEDSTMISQFLTTASGRRRMSKVHGDSIASLIKRLGETYYFAK